jgi:energy-coupling factor transporter ATP-binding protein EcfA2
MHLNRLVLQNFKKYRHAEVDFQDGLTGIVGNNGSGKSTIVEAIAWALYGNKVSTIKRDYIKNIRAGDSDSVEVQLSLSMGKNELLISRSMRGRSLLAEASLSLDGRMVAAGSKEVDQKLAEILKISFHDFMRTFYARQKDLDNLLKEGGAGKREYLLKLLGLDEIRERAIERMKADTGALREEESRLKGALEELGDVESRQAYPTLQPSMPSRRQGRRCFLSWPKSESMSWRCLQRRRGRATCWLRSSLPWPAWQRRKARLWPQLISSLRRWRGREGFWRSSHPSSCGLRPAERGYSF